MRISPWTYPFFVFLAIALLQPRLTQADDKVDKWEKDIAAFEASDAKKPPLIDGILFVGSSSIRLWNLAESFPDLNTINRGFGGSELEDSVRYARRIVIPHRPRVVVLYAGDNDLANGKSPQRVLKDFRDFIDLVSEALPETKIVYIGVKPSIKRWHLIVKIREANRLVRDDIAERKSERVVFVDIEPAMLGDDGMPRKDLLQDDGLHLNKEGYKVLTKLLRPHLAAPGSDGA